MYMLRTWYVGVLWIVLGTCFQAMYSNTRAVVYVGDTDIATYVSIDQTTYYVIEEIQDLVNDIASQLTVPYYLPSSIASRLGRIKILWSTFAHNWHDFIYTYVAERGEHIDDLYLLRDHFVDIVMNTYEAQQQGICIFEYHTNECMSLLQRMIDLTKRPWFGWSSTTLVKISQVCQEILDISDEYI